MSMSFYERMDWPDISLISLTWQTPCIVLGMELEPFGVLKTFQTSWPCKFHFLINVCLR